MQYRENKCVDIDECSSECLNSCNNLNEICVNEPGSYQCVCKNGYNSLEGTNCYDTDECLNGLHKCGSNSYCVNTIGSYNCYCQRGFYSNGTYCEGNILWL